MSLNLRVPWFMELVIGYLLRKMWHCYNIPSTCKSVISPEVTDCYTFHTVKVGHSCDFNLILTHAHFGPCCYGNCKHTSPTPSFVSFLMTHLTIITMSKLINLNKHKHSDISVWEHVWRSGRNWEMGVIQCWTHAKASVSTTAISSWIRD